MHTSVRPTSASNPDADAGPKFKPDDGGAKSLDYTHVHEVEQVVEPAARIGRRPTVKLGLHLRYPLAWTDRPVLRRCATIRQCIFRHYRFLPFSSTTLARAVRVHTGYARANHEAHALIRQALTGSGDIDPGDGVLTVRLDPLPTRRATNAIAELCEHLTATQTGSSHLSGVAP